MGVVGRPLIDQRAFARLEHQQHPARAAAQGLAHRDELVTPTLDAAEVGGQRERAGRRHRLAITAQAAANMLLSSSQILPPAQCLAIAMESAIYASKMRANAPAETTTAVGHA